MEDNDSLYHVISVVTNHFSENATILLHKKMRNLQYSESILNVRHWPYIRKQNFRHLYKLFSLSFVIVCLGQEIWSYKTTSFFDVLHRNSLLRGYSYCKLRRLKFIKLLSRRTNCISALKRKLYTEIIAPYCETPKHQWINILCKIKNSLGAETKGTMLQRNK